MKSQHTGSCLCGAVNFRVLGDFQNFYLCHCTHCRKDTGSAHAANLFSSTATLQWVTGEELVRRFDLPGTRHGRSFCATCGSALPVVQMDGALLVVPAGSLDSSLALTPDAHLFVSSSAQWDHDLENVPTFERLPV